MRTIRLIKISAAVLLPLTLFAAAPVIDTEDAVTEQRLQWWDEARFGMFIHWGVYAVPGGRYETKPGKRGARVVWMMSRAEMPVAEYKEFAREFNPVKYDPEAWVRLAEEAGMKYMVLTAKHHDGFALFDSQVTDWDVVDATPYGKDLMAPFAEACQTRGMRYGFYYSQSQDWVHPGGHAYFGGPWDGAQHGSMDEYIDRIAVPQVKEILSNYEGEILWWDTPRGMTPEYVEKFQSVLADYPYVITNNRLLLGGGTGDFDTPEQNIPVLGYPDDRRFEVCMTMNGVWGYAYDDHNWKSTEELILKLSDIVSKGGNFLLNVGPTKEGEIPEPSIKRLKQIGKWMSINGDCIYGTERNPFFYLPWGRATIKGQKLFLHVVNWPENGVLQVPLMNRTVKAYTLRTPESELKVQQFSDKVEISVPAEAPDPILSIVVLEFEGDAPVLHPIPTRGKRGKASSVDPDTSVSNLFDGDLRSTWRAAADENEAWIEIDLEEEFRITNLMLAEHWRIQLRLRDAQKVTLQYKKDGDWVDVTEGKTTGGGYSQDFSPVKGRFFRLKITGPNGKAPALNQVILNRAL